MGFTVPVYFKYLLSYVACLAIPNKSAYMDDETWEKVVKVVTSGVRKMKASNDFL